MFFARVASDSQSMANANLKTEKKNPFKKPKSELFKSVINGFMLTNYGYANQYL